MKTFIAFFAALVLGTASAAIKESAVVQPEAEYGEVQKPKTTFRYPEEHLIEDDIVLDLVEIGDKRKIYFQQSKLQRKLSDSNRRRAKKSSSKSSSTDDPCASSSSSLKSSKKSSSGYGCPSVQLAAAPVIQPVYIAPLAPVAQPVAAPVTVPFYVPVAAPASPPVGAPVFVTISYSSYSSASSAKNPVPVASPVSTAGTSAPVAPASVQASSNSPVLSPTTTAAVAAGGTTAPVVTAGGTTAPVAGAIYVEATAKDCQAITTGTGLVQGQNGMDSETFTFSFTLGTVTATNMASVVATAKAALQALVAQNVVSCGSSGKGKGGKRSRVRRKLQKKTRGRGLQKNRHNKQRRRHLLEDNVVGNVNWDLDCVETAPCDNPGTCFDCTVTMTVFLKGAASEEEIEEEFQALFASPTFLEDSGLDGFATEFQPTEITHEVVTTTTLLSDVGDEDEAGDESGNEVTTTTLLSDVGDEDEAGDESGNEVTTTTLLSDVGDEDEAGDESGTELGDEPGSNAGSRGDPHFKSWEGEHFEFHGQCDLVLARDPKFAGLGLDVQIRTKLVRYWSYIKSAAVRIGDDIVEVEGSVDIEDQLSNYWVNFELQGKQRTIGGFPLTYFDDHARPYPKRRFEIDLGSKYPGQKIVIATFKEFVKVDFANASKEAYGNTVGILGDYQSGLTYARDQTTVIHDFNDLGEEWQVRPYDDMMMFHDVEQPQFPKQCLLPEDPHGQRRRRLGSSTISTEEAESACASLKDPMDIKDCVYDILATQDLDMVGAF